MEPFLGEIMLFGGSFAPRGWALCDGQILSINQNQSLFSLLGTIYGGDGRTTFALPDLRGRAPLHQGTGPGLTPRSMGYKSGSEQVALSQNQMPSHTHALMASTDEADSAEAAGRVLADTNAALYSMATPLADMSNQAIGTTGGGQFLSGSAYGG